jgi:CubicO group peptidase (beta-lactamase class C family)
MRIPATLLGAAASLMLFGAPSMADARDQIKASELRSTAAPNRLVDNEWFAAIEGAEPAKHDFTGTLVLQEIEMGTDPAQFSSRDVLGKDPKIFPAISIAFFTEGGDLVPASQDVIRYGSTKEGRSYWDVIVQPGRVWSEPDDDGWSRAAFPFALVHSIEGETHNGLATFLYNAEAVSNLHFQIVQQTSPYYIVDFFKAWGQVPTSYRPGGIDDLEMRKAAYAAERKDRQPIKRWDDLSAQIEADKLDGFESAMNQDEVLVSGLAYKGTLYLKPCKSASGPIPYCDRMRFGVWSVTKSAANAVALLRLAQKYGEAVFDAKIEDYVEITAEHDGWRDVTFGDTLNMATGVGFGTAKRDPNAIEDGYLEGNYAAWYEAPSVAQKLAETFKAPDLPWGPGEVARYRDQDAFLLGVVMDRFLKAKEGPGADIWSMLVKEVYGPIGIHHAPTNRTIEPDGSSGHPLMAYGFYPTLGDLAKIAQLYHDRGQHNGVQILHAGKIDELLYGTKERGLPSGEENKLGETRYFRAFWNARFDSPEGCRLYIPEMHGWGGNIVSLLPGGMTGVRLAKNWESNEAVNDTTGIMTVASRLTSFCKQ